MRPETITQIEHVAIGVIHATRFKNPAAARQTLLMYARELEQLACEAPTEPASRRIPIKEARR